MKKVTILKSFLNKQGGIEKNVWHIAEAFSKLNYQVNILTSGLKNNIPLQNVQVHSFDILDTNLSFLKILQFDKKCRNYLSSCPSDIVFGMDRNSFQTHIRAGNGCHRAYLNIRKKNENYLKNFSFSINPLHRVILNLEKKAFESPGLKKLIVNSRMVKDQILDCYNTEEKKIHVIHNGVEWEKLQNPFNEKAEEKKRFFNDMHLSDDLYSLLFIGNGYARKGLEMLLYALSVLKEKNFILFVVGKDKNENYYKSLAIKLKIEKHVKFMGMTSNILRYYQACDILALPTFYDPFANVTLEALSMGLFVITSKQNGASEILTPSQGIAVEDPSNYEEIASALEVAMKGRDKENIRRSVESFDFSKQLEKVISACR